MQAYNPRLQEWSVEPSLTNPRHKACAVTIDNTVVLTGGTSLGLGKIKPQWLAEIGTRSAVSFDGQQWSSLPSMNRAKVRIDKFAEYPNINTGLRDYTLKAASLCTSH